MRYRQGTYDEAISWCQKSLTVASEIRSREGRQVVAQANYLLGNVYVRRGDLQRAVRLYHESVDVYQQIDDIAGQARAYNGLGNAYNELGAWSQASETFHKSLAIRQEIGDIQGQGFVTNNLGNIYLHRGNWTEAADLFQESNGIWTQLGAALPEGVTLSNLAQVYIHQGNWPQARDCLSRSEDIFAETGSEVFLPELERRWGEFYLESAALDEALTHTRRSIELAMAQRARLEEGMSRRVLGRVYLARGERELAEANCARAWRYCAIWTASTKSPGRPWPWRAWSWSKAGQRQRSSWHKPSVPLRGWAQRPIWPKRSPSHDEPQSVLRSKRGHGVAVPSLWSSYAAIIAPQSRRTTRTD